jgi:D-alanyl-D-alanine dipeptidase
MKKLLLLLVVFGFSQTYSQLKNPYGLEVINEYSIYKKSVELDKNKQLIEIKKRIPTIKLDIRYAGKNNFAKQAVYKQARAFARLPVVDALENVQDELKKSGYGLKIFDGYRPYSVTVKFFAIASDKSFVANPKDGSRHNRGCAIDLTLIDLRTGRDLEMPTSYDSFAVEAASDFNNLPAKIIQNRKLLRDTMEKHGFRVLNNEWWHFDFIGWQNYDLIDIAFEDL